MSLLKFISTSGLPEDIQSLLKACSVKPLHRIDRSVFMSRVKDDDTIRLVILFQKIDELYAREKNGMIVFRVALH
jgi:hypothetical protein